MPIVQGLTSLLLLAFSSLIAVELHASANKEENSADDAETFNTFHVKPNRCIALHQGQVCYQKIKFHWESPINGDYCLLQSSQAAPIICWKGNNLLQYNHKFESADNEIFFIRNENTSEIIGKVTVNVAWVYKSRKRLSASWRIF